MQPLRVALMTHSTNPRGGVSHCLALAEALTELGHDTVVHAPDPAGRGFFRKARCGTVAVPAGRIESLSTADMVEQRIDDYWDWFRPPGHRAFDIYHAHDGIGGNALADLTAAGLIPGFVRTVHHLDHFADPRIEARQVRAVTAAECVLCVSDVWADTLKRDFGVTARRVRNGVDTTAFSPRPDASDQRVRNQWGLGRGPVFLAVGGLEPRKNSLRLVEAFAAVRGRYPEAQLVVVGGASVLDHADYARRCLAAISEHGLDTGAVPPLVITGPVPQSDMPALYRIADTLAFPSLVEGFGLAVLEAMASGTPVVVSRIAPFTQYLGDADALWATPTDTDSIVAALDASLDPGRRRVSIERGHDVAARHDWASSALDHVELYTALVRAGETAHA